MSENYRISLQAEKYTTQKIVDLLDQETSLPDCPVASTAVAFFELPDQNWGLECYVAELPELDQIRNYLLTHIKIDRELQLEIAPVANTDWVAHVQDTMPPVRCGRFVCFGSHDREKIAASRYSIEINAGQAFGTSHHGTTQGCLKAIDRLARKRSFERVLDIGTGTGILAVAASRSWPRATITATELDPVAAKIAARNSRLNRVANSMSVVQANGLSCPYVRQRSYDLILANILAAPLKRMGSDIARRLTPGGMAVLSGIVETQFRRLEAHYRQYGFTLETRVCLEGWITLIMSRP